MNVMELKMRVNSILGYSLSVFYDAADMSEGTCYVNWLIGVETGRLLGK
ncbi:hypothetical protein ABH966_000062 [Lysinibacillus sp. RC46]